MGFFSSKEYKRFEKKIIKIVYFFSYNLTDDFILYKKKTISFIFPKIFLSSFVIAAIRCAEKENINNDEIKNNLINAEKFKSNFDLWLSLAQLEHDKIFKLKPDSNQEDIIKKIHELHSEVVEKMVEAKTKNLNNLELYSSKATKLVEKLYDSIEK